MAASYLSLESLAPAFNKNALIIVPNNRLRNQLLRAFAQQQSTKAWLKPNLQSLSEWLHNQWEALQGKAISYSCVAIASPVQRQILWEAAIKNSASGATLLQPKALAQQADSAFKNLELWRLSENTQLSQFFDPDSNSAQFSLWLKEFKRNLALQNTITLEASYELTAQAFLKNDLPKYDEIYLEGFDDLPPLMHYVLQSASHKIIQLENQTAPHTQIFRTQTKTIDEEILASALWAKHILQHTPDTALIGIVVPNLGQCRDKVERIFTEVFEAHALLPNVNRYTLPFNFSAGTPLGSAPIINSFFELLNLHDKEWPLERLCNLLTSPFWGDEQQESIARAHLILQLRKLGRITLSTADLRFCAHELEQRIAECQQAQLSHRFETVGNLLRRRFDHKSVSEWLMLFDELMVAMNWPGTRRLDSQEYQQLNQWNSLRDDFIAMDAYLAPITYQQAGRYFRELADKTPFQAQTPDSPIQILGALEAAGLQFSHLWVMGLSDTQWPPAPAPNPLLPLQLQRDYQMPHASVARELEIAQGLTQRYRQSAQHVIFSSAHNDGDSELRPSTLIRDIVCTPLEHIVYETHSALENYYQALALTTQQEIIQDSDGPELQPDEIVRGGSNLFKYQAACPFEAFTRLRLGAKNPDEPVMGFSAAERGTLLHESLAIIWRELKNSHALKALNNTDLYHLIDTKTQFLIDNAQAKNPRKLGKIYCGLEQKRLTQLLFEWLQTERERPDFNVIAIEQDEEIHFAGLTLKLRIDRIDEFNNGDRMLIDYKTGSASAKSWQGERMSEPQLPLYSVTREDITAISFAQINRKAQKWDGLGELHDTSLGQEGIKPADNWPLQLQQWQEQLQQLATDFIKGDARVDFKDVVAQEYAQDLAPLTRLADAEALQQFSFSEITQ